MTDRLHRFAATILARHRRANAHTNSNADGEPQASGAKHEATAAPMPIPRTMPSPICMDDADAGRFIFSSFPYCPPVGGIICLGLLFRSERAALFREMTPSAAPRATPIATPTPMLCIGTPSPAPIAAPRATPMPMFIGFAAIEFSFSKQARARRPRLHVCATSLLRYQAVPA